MWSASKSVGGRVCELSSACASCHAPIVIASRTTIHPDGVIHVVSRIIVPGSYRLVPGTDVPYGPSRNPPARRSNSAPNTLGESNRGMHIHSIVPSGATSAPVWQSERNP